jgi:Mor family transcriptional regulator
MSDRNITDPEDNKLIKLYIAAIKEALRKEAVSAAVNKKKKSGCLPGENYPGQIEKNKKRDKQIYEERLSDGTTFRELGMKHNLSGTRVSVIFYRQVRAERRRKANLEYMKKPLKERLEGERIAEEKREKVYRDVQKIFGKDLVP